MSREAAARYDKVGRYRCLRLVTLSESTGTDTDQSLTVHPVSYHRRQAPGYRPTLCTTLCTNLEQWGHKDSLAHGQGKSEGSRLPGQYRNFIKGPTSYLATTPIVPLGTQYKNKGSSRGLGTQSNLFYRTMSQEILVTRFESTKSSTQ